MLFCRSYIFYHFALSVFIQNQTGSVSIAVILISVIAMLWNFIFNIGF